MHTRESCQLKFKSFVAYRRMETKRKEKSSTVPPPMAGRIRVEQLSSMQLSTGFKSEQIRPSVHT
jgi:hypothetical protein